MSYAAKDLSVALGSPAELYKFNYNAESHRVCTLDGSVGNYMHLGEDYTPATIGRGTTEATEEMPRNSLDIRVPRDFPVAKLFISAPPEGVISLTIFRLHLNDTSGEYITTFKGRVVSCSFKGDEATLTCEPIFTSLRRPGLRMTYDAQCVHGLYTQGCRLIKDDWKVLGSVLSASATTVIVQQAADKPDGWYKGGMFESGDVGRVITSHAGATLTLMHPVPTSLTGADCKIYPGCDHTRSMTSGCGKFNNGVNYGGEPWLPLKNPFAGDNIFW